MLALDSMYLALWLFIRVITRCRLLRNNSYPPGVRCKPDTIINPTRTVRSMDSVILTVVIWKNMDNNTWSHHRQLRSKTDFDRFETRRTNLRHVITARLLRASFCACREVPVGSKNWKFSKKNIAIYFKHIYYAERVLGYVFLPKIPISSNLPRGSRKGWNMG